MAMSDTHKLWLTMSQFPPLVHITNANIQCAYYFVLNFVLGTR